VSRQVPDRNIALELVRVTEAGAMAAARWIGRGDKEAADKAAVDAMRYVLDSVAMRGVVVIGEGEKDEAPMLYNGEEVGSGEGPDVDVAVDPLEGTRLTALGQPNAICVIAVAERGTMLFPGAAVYMEKIAVGPAAIDSIDITRSPAENVHAVAGAIGKTPREVDVVVLERERHELLIDELRDAGARVRLIRDGDVAPSIAAGPTAIFSMYTAAPGKSIVPRSATAMTQIALGCPSAVSRVPSSGSTATSTSGPSPLPICSPL